MKQLESYMLIVMEHISVKIDYLKERLKHFSMVSSVSMNGWTVLQSQLQLQSTLEPRLPSSVQSNSTFSFEGIF